MKCVKYLYKKITVLTAILCLCTPLANAVNTRGVNLDGVFDEGFNNFLELKGEKVIRPELTTADYIFPGKGFCSETGQVSANACYKIMTKGDKTDEILLHTYGDEGYLAEKFGLKYHEFYDETSSETSVSIGGPDLSSVGMEQSYMESIKETDKNLSINFLLYATNHVGFESASFGEETLNKKGLYVLNKEGLSGFKKKCGDYFITGYQQGVILAFSLIVEFEEVVHKSEFRRHVGVDFGGMNIGKVANTLRAKSATTDIPITIKIVARQKGGTPGALGKVMGEKNRQGEFYAAVCDEKNHTDCFKIAAGLYKYTLDDLPEQTRDTKTYVPLGRNYIDIVPISELDLTE